MGIISLLGCVGFVALAVLSVIFNGWAFATLWNWFMIPILKLPAISITQAIALVMTFRYVLNNEETTKEPKSSEESKQVLMTSVVMMFAKPVAAVVFGWILLQFM